MERKREIALYAQDHGIRAAIDRYCVSDATVRTYAKNSGVELNVREPRRKLDAATVERVLLRWQYQPNRKWKQIGRDFGVSGCVVGRIIRGEVHRDVRPDIERLAPPVEEEEPACNRAHLAAIMVMGHCEFSEEWYGVTVRWLPNRRLKDKGMLPMRCSQPFLRDAVTGLYKAILCEMAVLRGYRREREVCNAG